MLSHNEDCGDTSSYVADEEPVILGIQQSLDLSPWERLYEEGMRQEERRLRLQGRASADRAARSLFDHQCANAEVSSGGDKMRGFVDRQREWLGKREDRLQKLREAAELDEMRRLQPPAINEASFKMAERAGHEGPIRGWEAHFVRYSLRSAVNPSIPTHTFRPNINLNACSSGKCGKNVGDRLYSDNIDRRRRLGELTMKYREDEIIDGCTGKPFFTPQFIWTKEGDTEAAQSRRSAAEATEALYLKAKERLERYKALVEQQQEHHTFSPDISRRSRKIAARRKANKEKCQEVLPEPPAPKEKKRKVNLSEFFSRRDGCLARRKEKLADMERQIREREQQECTFNPRISRRSVEIFEGSQQRYSSISSPQDAVQVQKISDTPDGGEFVSHGEGVDIMCNSASPCVYETGLPASKVATHYTHEYNNSNGSGDIEEDDGSKLVGEFRNKMKELLDEWRSLECV